MRSITSANAFLRPQTLQRAHPLVNTNKFLVLCSVHPSIQQNFLCRTISPLLQEAPKVTGGQMLSCPCSSCSPSPPHPALHVLNPSGLPGSHTTWNTPYTSSHPLECLRINPYTAVSASTKPGDLELGSYSSLSHLTLLPRVTTLAPERLMLYLFEEVDWRY